MVSAQACAVGDKIFAQKKSSHRAGTPLLCGFSKKTFPQSFQNKRRHNANNSKNTQND